ncbi:hypothetical protein SK069_10820 [Patulibacter brassicae]|uniref:Uncharacterized protein n=1 Tax=Patulibacter brassicae TaxID=1705717 RepID=A0ABU4VMG6_9ACTN|nr:hypothetical protein [Patulibacter brassicae]MDX8152088.1 hypothetical protein [Patulibacter brassicae]
MTDPLFPSGHTPGPWLVLTNRSNVVDYIASGLVRPKEGLEKYYADLSDLVPLRVPVVAGPLSVELIERVADRPIHFPVALEIAADAVSSTTDDRVGSLKVATLDAIAKVHLETEDDLDELVARTFDNVDWSRVEYAVSPELFSGGDLTLEAVREALSGTQDGPAPKFELEDRLAGARLMALSTAEAHHDLDAVALVALDAGQARTAAGGPGEWFVIDDSLASYSPSEGASFDERLFRAAAARCISTSRSDVWDGARLVGEIDELLKADHEVDGDDLARWAKAAERIREIVDAVRTFERLTTTEYSSEAAVLLAALRGRPADVLALMLEDIGGDAWTVTAAATLIGLVHGRHAMSVELRPEALDSVLARMERSRLIGSPWTPTVEVAADGAKSSLKVDGAAILEVPLPPKPLHDLLASIDVDISANREAVLEVVRIAGWQEVIRTTVIVPGTFSHTVERKTSRIEFHGDPVIEQGVDRTALEHRLETDADALRPVLERLVAEQHEAR